MGQKMYFYELYKLEKKSSTNPISVSKWEIAPFLLQSILGKVTKISVQKKGVNIAFSMNEFLQLFDGSMYLKYVSV